MIETCLKCDPLGLYPNRRGNSYLERAVAMSV